MSSGPLDPKTAARFQRLGHAFSVGWLAPLMSGGLAQVTQTLPPHALDTIAASRPTDHDADVAAHEAFHRLAAEVAPVGTLPYPDRGTWAMAMAGHNLLALTDPLVSRALFPSQARRIVRWSWALLAQAGDPRTRGEALMRHAFLTRYRDLHREDHVVKNWAYTYRFFGRRVPANVTAMPKLRFVKKMQQHAALDTLWADALGARTTRALGDSLSSVRSALDQRSPLTRLLDLNDLARGDSFAFDASALSVVADDALRHGVAQALATEGVSGSQLATARLGRSMRRLLAASDSGTLKAGDEASRALGAVVLFALELAFLLILDRGAPADGPAALGDADISLFWAVLSVALSRPDDLDAYQDLSRSSRTRVERWVREIDARVGPDASSTAHRLLSRASLPRVAPAASASGRLPVAHSLNPA